MTKLGDLVRGVLAPRQDRAGADTLTYMLGDASRLRQSSGRVRPISQDQALKHSVWWAGLILRANVMSTMPMQVFRPAPGGLLSRVASPPKVFDEPYPGIDISEFLFSAQMDLDRYGNFVGIIRSRTHLGNVLEIEPVSMADCTARLSGNRIVEWRIGDESVPPSEVWHQKQYVMAGFPLGLSPLAYAARSMGIYESAEDFVLDWFAVGASPRGVLKNARRDRLAPRVLDDAREGFKRATKNGDIFVTSNEWEWTPAAQDQMSSNFLAVQANSDRDVCRYIGVPGAMIDVEISTGNITYANANQANLQWLITQIGPAAHRAERYWSAKATPTPWTVKQNTDALLRMDPATRTTVMVEQGNALLRTPTELRALDNLPAYTPDQLTELGFFAALRKPPAAPAGAGPTGGTTDGP